MNRSQMRGKQKYSDLQLIMRQKFSEGVVVMFSTYQKKARQKIPPRFTIVNDMEEIQQGSFW